MSTPGARHRAVTPRRYRPVAAGEVAFLALLTWVPLLFGAQGRLNADTKQYLYLDPGHLLERARSLWDTSVGGGAVTHQTIGYLWPMGPYYWLMDVVGVPDWAAQRIWIGSIQLLAALGALVLFRTFFPRRHPAQLVAAVGYGLSPFVLGHVTGQSALLLPFAAFGWLVWCMVRGLDERSWRWPAAFALIVATCGSLNGSSVFFVILGAALWVPFGVLTLGRGTVRDGIVLLARAGGLTIACQLWWLVGYVVGGRYGLPILSVTETVAATSSTTSAAEILRGLGYWVFYGGDVHALWLEGLAPPYQETPAVLLATFAVPVLALVLAARLRWSARGYFAALVTIGTLICTVSFGSPWRSPAGAAFEEASKRIDLVLSLRNTQRAAPLVVLGLMGLLAGSLTALSAKRVQHALVAAGLLLVAMAGAMPAQWRDGLIAHRFHRDEDIPSWWTEAGEELDAGDGTILELPGIDFASYRWGHTLDPVSVGLTDRPVIARELVPQGGPLGVSLLNALDRSLQEGWYEPESIVPAARLLGAATLLARNDLEYERYRTIRPPRLWSLLTDPATGLAERVDVGPPTANQAAADQPMLDEIELGLDPTAPPPPPVGIFTVPGGDRPALSAWPAGSPTVVDGNGEGILAAATAGLLDDRGGPLLLGADLTRPATPPELFGASPRWIVTDSNRKQEERWYSLRENVGATEPRDGKAVERSEPGGRVELVPDVPDDARTVVAWTGADRIWATDYGNDVTLAPEDRPSNAFDGDPRTAWRVATATASPHRIGIELTRPAQADHVVLVQPQGRPGTQRLTEAEVLLDGERRFTVDIPAKDAFDPDGFRVDLDGEPFERLEVALVRADQVLGPVGLAEVTIPGVAVHEVVVLPTAVLEQAGSSLGTSPLAVVLSRLRADPAEPLRADAELVMRRRLDLPGPASFEVSGTARLRSDVDDALIDDLTGRTGPVTRSSQHLPGDLGARAAAAFDGDLTTAWSTPFVGIDDQWWEVDTGDEIELDEIVLDIVADDRHSLPTRVSVSVDGGDAVGLRVPALERGPTGTVREVRLPLPETLEGRTVRITIEAAERRDTQDWYTEAAVALPVALAEVALPDVDEVEPGTEVDTECRDDLLEIDGQPVSVRITGSADDALARAGLDIAGCDGPIELAAGTHELVTTSGVHTGLDLDRVVLRTSAWDAAPGPTETGPSVEVVSTGRGSARGTLDSDGAPFWLVLDQSDNPGWELEVVDADGRRAAVDGPHPAEGNAAAWYVRPVGAGPLDVRATWTPQRGVDLALSASIVAALVCLLLVALHPRRPLRAAAPHYSPPRLHAGANVAWRRGLSWAAATTVVAGVFIHPAAAVPTGLAMCVFTSRPRWGRLIPPALVAASAVIVIFLQVRDEHPPSGAWPEHFGLAHLLAMMAVVLLGMEALAEAARHRKARIAREERERQRAEGRRPGTLQP